MNTIGLSSRIALLSSPLASFGFAGITTFRPGMCAHSASVDWLCCAASMCAEPPGPRNTTGSVNCPPDICRILAALLIS